MENTIQKLKKWKEIILVIYDKDFQSQEVKVTRIIEIKNTVRLQTFLTTKFTSTKISILQAQEILISMTSRSFVKELHSLAKI